MREYELSTATHRRASDQRARSERALGRARLLDRRRLARRAGGARRRLALHRAPALQGLPDALGPGDRGDLRQPRRRAQRRHLARDDRRLRPRPGRPARAGARRRRRDMVYEPVFAEVDSEREVVLEEIAMVEDNPQDLVHDIVAEAVFGGHAIGRPVIGSAEVISSVTPRSLTAYHRDAYAGDNIVVPPRRERRPRPARRAPRRAAPRNARLGDTPRKPLARTPSSVSASSARTPSSTTSCSARSASRARRAPLRGLAPRRDPRRLGVVAAVPGDPREARYGVRRLQLRLAVLGHGRSGLRRHARGQPRASASRSRRAARGYGRGQRADGELERAKENLKGRFLLSLESTSNRMSRLGKSLVTDRACCRSRELDEIDGVSAEDVARWPRAARPERFSAAGIGPSEGAFSRASSGSIPRSWPVPS